MPRQIHLQGHEPETRVASGDQFGWALVAVMVLLIIAILWGIGSGLF